MQVRYNDKAFLLPNSPESMSCYHAKIDGETMKLTIHDCRNSIQLWNDLTTHLGRTDAIKKLQTLETGIKQLRLTIQNMNV